MSSASYREAGATGARNWAGAQGKEELCAPSVLKLGTGPTRRQGRRLARSVEFVASLAGKRPNARPNARPRAPRVGVRVAFHKVTWYEAGSIKWLDGFLSSLRSARLPDGISTARI